MRFLSNYGGLEHQRDFAKLKDEKNQRIVMQEQFDLIQKQKQAILEASKFREESRKASKLATRRANIGIVIAIATLIATVIGWFI